MNEVFSPKVVMEHQQEIGLRPDQVEAMKTAMADTQRKLLDPQWRLDAETEASRSWWPPIAVDEAAAVATLDQVTAIERDVKRVNFALLVRSRIASIPSSRRSCASTGRDVRTAPVDRRRHRRTERRPARRGVDGRLRDRRREHDRAAGERRAPTRSPCTSHVHAGLSAGSSSMSSDASSAGTSRMPIESRPYESAI